MIRANGGNSDGGRILLIGSDGMLGQQWGHCLDVRGIPVDAPLMDRLDFMNPQSIRAQVNDDTALVINCAAYTDVDGCEQNAAVADRINGTAVGDLARQCAKCGAMLLHYSTDYVFDGRTTRPYQPDSPLQPINAYGRSKALGEQLIKSSQCAHLIIRTSWLYAPWAKNFVRTMIRLMADRPTVSVVNDQFGCPTSAEHLVDASLALLLGGTHGICHVTDGGQCSWYEFAGEIARLTGSSCIVEPCTTAEFPRPAARPAYSVLDTTSSESVIGAMPGWKKNLAAVLSQLEPVQS